MFEDFPDFEDAVEYYMDEGYTREEAEAMAHAKFLGEDD